MGVDSVAPPDSVAPGLDGNVYPIYVIQQGTPGNTEGKWFLGLGVVNLMIVSTYLFVAIITFIIGLIAVIYGGMWGFYLWIPLPPALLNLAGIIIAMVASMKKSLCALISALVVLFFIDILEIGMTVLWLVLTIIEASADSFQLPWLMYHSFGTVVACVFWGFGIQRCWRITHPVGNGEYQGQVVEHPMQIVQSESYCHV